MSHSCISCSSAPLLSLDPCSVPKASDHLCNYLSQMYLFLWPSLFFFSSPFSLLNLLVTGCFGLCFYFLVTQASNLLYFVLPLHVIELLPASLWVILFLLFYLLTSFIIFCYHCIFLISNSLYCFLFLWMVTRAVNGNHSPLIDRCYGLTMLVKKSIKS